MLCGFWCGKQGCVVSDVCVDGLLMICWDSSVGYKGGGVLLLVSRGEGFSEGLLGALLLGSWGL